MPLALNVSAVAVSGTLVKVCSVDLRGISSCRLYVLNAPTASGGNNLTAAQVKIGPDADNVTQVLDSTTFASLAQAAMLSLLISGPVAALEFYATCAAGTFLTVWIDNVLSDD